MKKKTKPAEMIRVEGGIVESPSDPALRKVLDQRRAERDRHRQPSWKDDPPTSKQLGYLRHLGFRGHVSTKGQASEEIDKLLAGDSEAVTIRIFDDHGRPVAPMKTKPDCNNFSSAWIMPWEFYPAPIFGLPSQTLSNDSDAP
jgi:hypothetical protein